MIVAAPVFVVVMVLVVTFVWLIARTTSRSTIAPPAAETQKAHAEWRRAKHAADEALQRWKQAPTDGNAVALRDANELLREAARARTATSEPQPTVAREVLAEVSDPIEQIRRLAELRDRGIITEEEFGQKKRELLERLG